MKKLILTISAVVITANMFANKDVEASLCSNTNSISIKDLQNCKELILNNEEWKVEYFQIGFIIGNDYQEYTMQSKDITENFFKKIEELTPARLYVERIMVSNKQNEKKTLPNLSIVVTE